MARTNKKDVYERIADKQSEIKTTENTLERLNGELQELFNERDDLQMHQLLDQVKASGLDINKALELLNISNNTKEDSKKK